MLEDSIILKFEIIGVLGIRKSILRLTFYQKDLSYPLSYIGSTSETLSKKLGISKIDAQKLIIFKIEEMLTQIKEEDVKIALQNRLHRERMKGMGTGKAKRKPKPYWEKPKNEGYGVNDGD
jgi:hypothetical protein